MQETMVIVSEEHRPADAATPPHKRPGRKKFPREALAKVGELLRPICLQALHRCETSRRVSDGSCPGRNG